MVHIIFICFSINVYVFFLFLSATRSLAFYHNYILSLISLNAEFFFSCRNTRKKKQKHTHTDTTHDKSLIKYLLTIEQALRWESENNGKKLKQKPAINKSVNCCIYLLIYVPNGCFVIFFLSMFPLSVIQVWIMHWFPFL